MNPKLVNYITKKWDCVVAGLEYRGFGPFDGSECSKGRCSTPDKKHFILFTDGMIIYSNIPDYDQARYDDKAVVYEWLQVGDFEFSVLDKILRGEVVELPYGKTTSRQFQCTSCGDLWYVRCGKPVSTYCTKCGNY